MRRALNLTGLGLLGALILWAYGLAFYVSALMIGTATGGLFPGVLVCTAIVSAVILIVVAESVNRN